MQDLQELRDMIDEIDDRLAELFNERMKVVEEVGAYKKENGLPVSDPEREKAVISQHIDLVDERFRDAYERFMKELFTISKDLEK